MTRYGMAVDLKRCIGCYGCVISCKAEHATPPGITGGRVLKEEYGKYPTVKRLSLPILCMQCQEPECLRVCPTGATSQRTDGIVVIDVDVCIGCRYCMTACPYAARYFNGEMLTYFEKEITPYEEVGYRKHPLGVVQKCDFCLDRVERGLEPSCVASCMAKSRYFGDMEDPSSEVSCQIRDRAGLQLNPEFGTDPSVYYLPA